METPISSAGFNGSFHPYVEGLEYCHAHEVWHRDLKNENILFDAEGNAKVGQHNKGSDWSTMYN